MKKEFLLLLGLLVFTGCSKPDKTETESAETVITFNDFEAIDGWFEVPPTVTRERAYSGKYSVKVDRENEFSFGFQKQLGQVINRRPNQFKLQARAYVPGEVNGKAELVFSLTNPTNNEVLLYKGIPLDKVKTFRTWARVDEEIVLPENIDFNTILKVYLWRGGATDPVYIDDLKLSLQ